MLTTLSAVVVAVSYEASLQSSSQLAAASSAGTSSSPGSGSASGTDTASGTGGSNSGSALADGDYTGDAVQTRYGGVQVRITVANGTITEVQVPQYPNREGRDVQISQRSLPILIQETKSAQSAGIDMVSGATYTSQGYLQSLQSALDQARA